jgi:hypothetical protein
MGSEPMLKVARGPSGLNVPVLEIIRAGHRYYNDDDDEVPVATSEVWTFSPRSPGEELSSPELLPDLSFHVVL